METPLPIPVPRFWPLFGIALGVRLTVVILGIWLATLPPTILPPDPVPLRLRDEIRATSAGIIEPWYHWDAGWMVTIARNGYVEAADNTGRLGTAFMPAMPGCLALALSLGLNPFWFGVLFANVAGAAGAAILTRVAVRLTQDRATGYRTLILLLAFPSSFFYSAPYNESFGLLFTALAMEAWMNRRAIQTGVYALCGSLARMTGVSVGVAALANWLVEDRTLTGLRRCLVVAAGSFAGICLFWCYLYWAVGDPFAGLKAHSSWGRRPLSVWNPWFAFHSIYDPEGPHWGQGFLVLVFALLGIRAWYRRGTFWGVLTLVPVGQMIASGTFLSGHRVILAALPGFIELADLLQKRLFFRVVVVGFTIAQILILFRYVHWLRAG